MHAIIYAAGRATRLGAAHSGQPKIMIEIGGKSLLERHLAHLSCAGIEQVSVVTGHLREQVASAIPELVARYHLPVQEIYNADYGEGSVISFHASLPALQAATGPILLMDGDVLYHGSILQRLLNSPHPTALLLDTRYSKIDDDPVLVPIRKGKPVELLKRWKGKADLVGESIGFFKIAGADIPLLTRETMAHTVGRRRLESYDEIIRALVKAGRFDFEDVTGLPWTEIDFPHDLEHARNTVLPACLARPLISVERSPRST